MFEAILGCLVLHHVLYVLTHLYDPLLLLLQVGLALLLLDHVVFEFVVIMAIG